MILSDIIAEIDEKYPNAVSSVSKVRKMDILQKRLYRKMRKQTYQSYSLVTGQPTYPISLNLDDILQIDVGNNTTNLFKQYPLKKINDQTVNYSQYHYFISDINAGDFIGIYPDPTDNETTMVVYSYEQPNSLASTNLNAIPSLDPNYHMLFVYYVCKEIAENYRDFDIANGFAIQFNALESEMMSTFQKPEVILVHNESGW